MLAGGAEENTPDYRRNINATAAWTVSSKSRLPDGGILSASNRIVPYDANLAAIALAGDRHFHPQVRDWIAWYIRHLNRLDKWGLSCTVYDYNVNGTTVTPANDADSTDSYAATFLTLAWTYWQAGDQDSRAYLTTLKSDLECIANVMVETQQTNGLTWAKPDYKTEYLMDNTEVYRGLKDAADLFETAFHDQERSGRYAFYASNAMHGIADTLWDPANGTYRIYAGAPPANWTVWYPDSTAQLFPALQGVLRPHDPKARLLYATFNTKWPHWTALSFPDAFPWALLSQAAALMGDTRRTDQYILSIEARYLQAGFQPPWYCAESGWFIRANESLLRREQLRR